MTLALRCVALAVAALALPSTLCDVIPARAALAAPIVASELLDASGAIVTGGTVSAGTEVRVTATVASGGPPPSGDVTFDHYATDDCTGAADGTAVALATQSIPISQTVDIPNDAGWDSATVWIANGADQFATNWFGGLFTGNDNAFFSSSSMAWRFNAVPVAPGDTVDRAYLSLRIRQSRPSLPSEGTWTWKAIFAADTHDGAGFQGETRAALLARFNALGPTWEIPLNSSTVDAFGTGDGAYLAPGPDITTLIQARVDDLSWSSGDDVVVGLLNHGTAGIAEAQVVDDPGNVVLHVESTTIVDEQQAASGPLTPPAGAHAYRAHYNGDVNYSPVDGPCLPLEVTPVPAVGGLAEAPDLPVLAPPSTAASSARRRGLTMISSSAALIAASAMLFALRRSGRGS
jgi:hypothetical protein